MFRGLPNNQNLIERTSTVNCSSLEPYLMLHSSLLFQMILLWNYGFLSFFLDFNTEIIEDENPKENASNSLWANLTVLSQSMRTYPWKHYRTRIPSLDLQFTMLNGYFKNRNRGLRPILWLSWLVKKYLTLTDIWCRSEYWHHQLWS